MEIKKMWIVTEASPVSTLGDIVFSTDPVGLANQFKGGLDPELIVGVYDNEPEALVRGAQVIVQRDDEAAAKGRLFDACGAMVGRKFCVRPSGHPGVHHAVRYRTGRTPQVAG